MAASLLVVAVNDREDQLAALEEWLSKKWPELSVLRGGWQDVCESLRGDCAAVLLRDLWPSPPDFVKATGRYFQAYLFVLDSNVSRDGDGDDALVGLLAILKGKWWGAISSEKIPQPVEKWVRELAEAHKIEPATIAEHFLGASQGWLGDSKSLIAQVLRLAREGGPLAGWRPSLVQAKPDELRAAVHWLASLALPIELDLETLKEKSGTDPGLRDLIWAEHFGGSAESYLGTNSTSHGQEAEGCAGTSVDRALDQQWKRLAGGLSEPEQARVEASLEGVRRALREARNKDAQAVVASLAAVAAAIGEARSAVQQLVDERREEQE